MTLSTRTARAIDWQLQQSLPDAAALLAALPKPKMPYLEAGCDFWDAATHECRRQELEARQVLDALEVWAALLTWHTAFAYARFALGAPGLKEAGELFRGGDVQGELRLTVLRMVEEIFE